MRARPELQTSAGTHAGGARLIAFAVIAALALQTVGPALAAQTIEIRLPASGDLVPAPFGYERISGNYAAAHATGIFISPYLWAGRVLGVEIRANQPIEVLAKVKDFDWLLVGTNGVPLGYVPLSAVSQRK